MLKECISGTKILITKNAVMTKKVFQRFSLSFLSEKIQKLTKTFASLKPLPHNDKNNI